MLYHLQTHTLTQIVYHPSSLNPSVKALLSQSSQCQQNMRPRNSEKEEMASDKEDSRKALWRK